MSINGKVKVKQTVDYPNGYSPTELQVIQDTNSSSELREAPKKPKHPVINSANSQNEFSTQQSTNRSGIKPGGPRVDQSM